eukprot:gene40851-biopygen34690
MSKTWASFETACNDLVSQEVDRLARLTPCDLMQLTCSSAEVSVAGIDARLVRRVADFGSTRHLGVVLLIPGILGFGERRFQGGIKVELLSQRMSDLEAVDLLD